MEVTRDYLTINEMSRPGIKLDSVSKLVLHYVLNPGSSAINNRNYFESLKNQNKIYASAHYIIGLSGEIIQLIPDDEVAWHSGNKYMNLNSIGIELCHIDKSGRFTEKTINSLIHLLSYLSKKFNLDPLKDIIRHYDVTGKLCPLYYVKNQKEFKKLKVEVKNFKI